jgi:hypothetical protein
MIVAVTAEPHGSDSLLGDGSKGIENLSLPNKDLASL